MTLDEAIEIAEAHCDLAMVTDADVPCALVTLAAHARKMRDALQRVRPWFTPETMMGKGMIKVVNDALPPNAVAQGRP